MFQIKYLSSAVLIATSAILSGVIFMRIPTLNIWRQFSIMASKQVNVEPYSMAFVTAPNKDVAKTLAGGLGTLQFL